MRACVFRTLASWNRNSRTERQNSEPVKRPQRGAARPQLRQGDRRRENRRVPSVFPSRTDTGQADQPASHTPTRRGRGRRSKPESLLSIPPSSSSSSLPNPRTRARDSLPPPRSSRTRYDSGNPPARALVGLRGRDWLMPPRLA